MGHAVYSLSDPRARVFKGFVEQLSQEKHREKEFKLMSDVERIAAGRIIFPQLISSSILWALHPEILATAKIGVYNSCGRPNILYTKPL